MNYQEVIEQAKENNKDKKSVYKSIPEVLSEIHPKVLYQQMPEIFADCEAIQKAVLAEIIALGQDSAYGKDHNFGEIKDLKQWQERVAPSKYEDYKEYIEKDMHGESNQLFMGQTALYIATTGSTGQMKYFVESDAGNGAKQLIMAIRGMYMSDLLPVTLDMDAKNLTISNYASVGESDKGKLIVRASGQTARNMRKKTGTMNILPVTFWESKGISAYDRDYMMGVYALAEKRFSKIFCNNLIHFGRILDRIKMEGEQMINDIRRGDFAVDLLPEVRQNLQETFPANPQRADELQTILTQEGSLANSPKEVALIWPNLSMTGCWLSAGVGRDAREVLRRLPKGVQCIDLGYGASEGKINIPTKLACSSGAAAPFACFYEFLPLDGDKPLCLWEVVDGEYYELLITTYSGLYRYNLEDVVRIDGFIGRTPNLEFCGKSSDFVLLGEKKIYSHNFLEALYQTEKTLPLAIDLLQAVKEGDGFSYILEIENCSEEKKEILKKTLDGFSEAIFNEASKRVYLMKKGYKNQLFTEKTRDDRGPCGIKLPVVVTDVPTMWIETILEN